MSAHSQLGREVLRDVSRSFYLSLRLLPKDFRDSASIGYLLARLSDTIADSGESDIATRGALLQEFGEAIQMGTAKDGFWRRLSALSSDSAISSAERVLLQRGADVLSWQEDLTPGRRDEVRRVLKVIITGQAWDLSRFEGEGVVPLSQDSELEGYAYQVAGCVGEFWTRIGFLYSEKFANAEQSKMEQLGRSYGQGLQLVNILRDLPEDLERGRCYLPCDESVSPEVLMRVRERWMERASECLDQGLDYCDQLTGVRVGVATGLPVLLGKLTLEKLRKASWEDLENRVKVSRSEVKKAGWHALRASLKGQNSRWKKECKALLESTDA